MLKAKYTTGSSCFLENSNDKDEVWFYETKEEANEARRKRKGGVKGIDVHYDYIRPLKVFLGCYIYHYSKLVEGEDLHLDEFSIFDHKEEYIELLKKYVSWLPKTEKKWYHILTACYMFDNNSYDLTDAQLTAIQRTHDKGITDAKYNYCLKQLGLVSLN